MRSGDSRSLGWNSGCRPIPTDDNDAVVATIYLQQMCVQSDILIVCWW